MRSVLKLIIILLLGTLLIFSAFAVGFGANYVVVKSQNVSTTVPSNFGLFWEAWKIVKGEYYGTIPAPQNMTHGAIRGMLQGLGDPHTVLVEPEPAKNEQSNLQGQTGDVGLNLDVRNRLLLVISPIPNSPGLCPSTRS